VDSGIDHAGIISLHRRLCFKDMPQVRGVCVTVRSPLSENADNSPSEGASSWLYRTSVYQSATGRRVGRLRCQLGAVYLPRHCDGQELRLLTYCLQRQSLTPSRILQSGCRVLAVPDPAGARHYVGNSGHLSSYLSPLECLPGESWHTRIEGRVRKQPGYPKVR
jgi:hypothetical protein